LCGRCGPQELWEQGGAQSLNACVSVKQVSYLRALRAENHRQAPARRAAAQGWPHSAPTDIACSPSRGRRADQALALADAWRATVSGDGVRGSETDRLASEHVSNFCLVPSDVTGLLTCPCGASVKLHEIYDTPKKLHIVMELASAAHHRPVGRNVTVIMQHSAVCTAHRVRPPLWSRRQRWAAQSQWA
jgi:hypothetical protein